MMAFQASALPVSFFLGAGGVSTRWRGGEWMGGVLTCVCLQSVAAATTELWPSMVNVMGAPWRNAGVRTQSKQSRIVQREEVVQPQGQSATAMRVC